MPRIRSVKPEFFKHWELYKAEEDSGLPVRLAYEGLWTVADREGRFRWVPQQLKLDVLPYDKVDFESVLHVLETGGWIVKYSVQNKDYGYIPTFTDHQRITGSEASSASKFPEPPWKHLGNTEEIHGNTIPVLSQPEDNTTDSFSIQNTWKHLGNTEEIHGNTLDDRRGEEERNKGNIESPPLDVFENLIFDIETALFDDQARYEAICMKTRKTDEVARDSLRKYHLHLIEKQEYPKPKSALFAGFEKWLMNEKKYGKNGNSDTPNGCSPTKLGTSTARTEALKKW